MSLFSFLSLKDFKPDLRKSRVDLLKRLDEHRVTRLEVHVYSPGEGAAVKYIKRAGKDWVDTTDSDGTPNYSAALFSNSSVQCAALELPPLSEGNTESAIAELLITKPSMVIKDSYRPDRRYFVITSTITGSRHALVASVNENEVQIAENEAMRRGRPCLRGVITSAAAFKFAARDVGQRFPQSNAVVVNDHRTILVAPVINRHVDFEKLSFLSIDPNEEETSLMDIRAKVDSVLIGKAGRVALYRTPFGKTTNLLPAGVQPDEHIINLSELCFA